MFNDVIDVTIMTRNSLYRIEHIRTLATQARLNKAAGLHRQRAKITPFVKFFR